MSIRFYGELVYYFGLHATDNAILPPPVDASLISSFDDLRQEVNRVRQDWSRFHSDQTGSLFNTDVAATGVYNFDEFSLQRFSTGFDPDRENHIGEVIVDKSKRIQYLITYRLSAAQCRRAYLLSQLAEQGWNLDDCAVTLQCHRQELILRLRNAGFGYLLTSLLRCLRNSDQMNSPYRPATI